MNEQRLRFLAIAGVLPFRLTAEEVSWLINCQPHDIPPLVSAKLLKPLGKPAPNGSKFFCTEEVMERAKDRSWLARASEVITQNWQFQNARKKLKSARGISIVNAAAA